MPLIRLRGSVRLIVIRPTFVACNHANCGRLAVTHACIYMYLVPTDGIQSIFLNSHVHLLFLLVKQSALRRNGRIILLLARARKLVKVAFMKVKQSSHWRFVC